MWTRLLRAWSCRPFQKCSERLGSPGPSGRGEVVLALLGLDLGRAPCDAARFVSLLAAPPAWEQLDSCLQTAGTRFQWWQAHQA